jgi:hypothetical protein
LSGADFGVTKVADFGAGDEFHCGLGDGGHGGAEYYLKVWISDSRERKRLWLEGGIIINSSILSEMADKFDLVAVRGKTVGFNWGRLMRSTLDSKTKIAGKGNFKILQGTVINGQAVPN